MAKEIEKVFYGELPIQIGYCNGHNVLLNAVEYHRSSEINLAATDAVLILGSEADVTDDFTYETSKMEAFRIPAGTAVEVYATTLHYAPCHVDDAGFQVAVILPKGTNYPLDEAHAGGEMHFLQQRINGSSVMPRAGCGGKSYRTHRQKFKCQRINFYRKNEVCTEKKKAEENKMNNIPEVKVGIVAVSRDCFPESLSVNRREALVKAYTDKYGAADIYECPICIVESRDPHGTGIRGHQESRM